jgi:hypothetical protein
MEFERLPADSGFDCKIAFDAEGEAEVISAVYSEHIVGLAKTGNIGSIQPFDRQMSNYAETKECPSKRFRSAARLIDMVQTFHNNTETAVTELALESGRPAYDNSHVAERLELGEKALELVDKLKEEAIIEDAIRQLDETSDLDPRINP